MLNDPVIPTPFHELRASSASPPLTRVIPTPSASSGQTARANERSGGISPVVSRAEIPRLHSQARSARDDRGEWEMQGLYPELVEGLGMTGGRISFCMAMYWCPG